MAAVKGCMFADHVFKFHGKQSNFESSHRGHKSGTTAAMTWGGGTIDIEQCTCIRKLFGAVQVIHYTLIFIDKRPILIVKKIF
jgi:hypothetical protein